MPRAIWLPSITAKLQNFLRDHLVIFAHSKCLYGKDYNEIKKTSNIVELIMTPDWRKLRKHKSVWFIRRQFFGKAFIVDDTTVS